MKTRSAKAKGRRLQQYVREQLLNKGWYNSDGSLPTVRWKLEAGDIKVALMGESGRDIILSPKGEECIPFDIECKNTEQTSPWAWIEQAEANTKQGRVPLVVFKRNNSKVYAIINFDDLLALL